MARASPSWPIWATLLTCGLERRALVATIPRVVLSPHCKRAAASGSNSKVSPSVPSSSRGPASTFLVRGSLTSPKAFTAARAPTTRPSARWAEALPSPPFIAPSIPRTFPTVAPVPAPTLPWAKSPLVADEAASYPIAASGRTEGSPTTTSKRTAAETRGMRATPMSRPTPFSSRKRTTPSTAASPKALPPVRSRACVGRTAPTGPRRSVSRVPGEEPRTSTPPTAPSWPSKRTAVQPVAASLCVAWPTNTPGTSHRLSSTPPLRVRTWGRFRQLPLFCVCGYDARVVPGQRAEGDQFLIRAPGTELDEDRILDHGVVDDLTLPVAELHGRVAEGRALLELLVSVVLVAHAALHFPATAQNFLVRRHALLLGQPDVDGTHTPGTAPRRAA